jgi:hypothetical protein
VKRVFFVLEAVLALTMVAAADEITFSVVGNGTMDITSSPSGMSAGPATAFQVTDITTGKSITISDPFSASAGTAHSVTVGPTVYNAVFSAGGADSVLITNGVSGTMLDKSDISAVFPNSTGSFSGEFTVTSFNQAILTALGVKGTVAPVGSIGITFGQDAVSGQTLTGVIGGASTTVLTVQTAPVPEPATWLMFWSGIGTLVAVWRARQMRT